ncbi:uncharacterized protein LOC122504211 [Leptopilina heterotoma]|uniref:uncharacterized protein LOC122504211 n=1 Tax=Leptopilina heterotoma TaxID=63436 RepID=UPI001CA7E2B7|nr:uncharacterized protein LOC122504211 [Leptopilina heterotoma]
MSAFVQVLKKDYNQADEKLGITEIVIDKFKSPIKKEVARHIFDATKAHLLLQRESNLTQVDELLKNIRDISDKIYQSSLNQFKAAIWIHCNHWNATTKRAIKFSEIAVEYDPEDATAHYLLAKNLRTDRRFISKSIYPRSDEIYHFGRAYEIEKNPQFGILFAQSLRENRDNRDSMKIYEELSNMKIENVPLQLRMAAAFIAFRDFGNSRKCLNYVESVEPENNTFLHHKGKYFMELMQYEEASKCLLKSAEEGNFGADMLYIKCIRMLQVPFDYTSHFLKLKEKYSDYNSPAKKEILINLAFCYFVFKKDFDEAVKHFVEFFEIGDSGYLLFKHFQFIPFLRPVNIYYFLEDEFLPKVNSYINSKRNIVSKETIQGSETLMKIAKQFSLNNPRTTNRTFYY